MRLNDAGRIRLRTEIEAGIVGRIDENAVLVRHEVIWHRRVGFAALLLVPVDAIGINRLAALVERIVFHAEAVKAVVFFRG